MWDRRVGSFFRTGVGGDVVVVANNGGVATLGTAPLETGTRCGCTATRPWGGPPTMDGDKAIAAPGGIIPRVGVPGGGDEGFVCSGGSVFGGPTFYLTSVCYMG